MTTIAYKAGVLAGDSLWADEHGDVTTLATKVFELPNGILYGGAGEDDDRALVQLLKRVKKPEQLPPISEIRKIKQDLAALIVFPSGRVFILDASSDKNGQAGICEIKEGQAAIGRGSIHALCAMDFGASAIEAVEFACKKNIHSRPPVTHVSLTAKRKR
jgi:hypothetical protein